VATINLPTYYLRSKGYVECSTRAHPEKSLSSDYFEQKTAKRVTRNQSRENLSQSRLRPISPLATSAKDAKTPRLRPCRPERSRFRRRTRNATLSTVRNVFHPGLSSPPASTHGQTADPRSGNEQLLPHRRAETLWRWLAGSHLGTDNRRVSSVLLPASPAQRP
jgi:hypothetical protein